MRGESFANTGVMASRMTRLWLGPVAMAALGFDLSQRISVDARVELGAVAPGATARDLGEPAAAVDGAWASLGLAAAFAL
jgi:hypothetical protein